MRKSFIRYLSGYILFILMLITISACKYKPVESYVVNLVPPGSAPEITFDLNLMTDTINFYWPSTVKLKIINGGLRVTRVRYFLDETEVFGVLSDSLYCISLKLGSAGIHKLRMIIRVSTGTNSIADYADEEAYVYNTRQWTLIGTDINPDINMKYTASESGLMLTWPRYDGINFKCYRLKEAGTGQTYEIYGINSESFTYTPYIGQECAFYLYVVDREGVENLWGKCSINKSLPALRMGAVNHQLALLWNKPAYIGEIREYQVFQSDWSFNWKKIANLTPNDTSLLINTNNVFAAEVCFYLYCVPYGNDPNNTSLFSSFLNIVHAAIPVPTFDGIIWSDCSCFYFCKLSSSQNKYFLCKYDFATDNEEILMEYNFLSSVSPDGKKMLNPVDSNLIILDIARDSVLANANVKKVVTNFDPSVGPVVSDNGICVFRADTMMYVFDIFNNRLIASAHANRKVTKISPDGKYFIVDDNDSIILYSISENSMSVQARYKHVYGLLGDKNYGFLPGQDDYLFMAEPGVVNIRSSQDFSVIKSVSITGSFFNIDFCSNRILTSPNSTDFNIYDYSNGNFIKTLHSDIWTGSQSWVLLENNTIYYSGYKYFVGD
jgi:hypothetical protein